ncbi:MAG: PQQ-binding-like beta-propeller repeat protein [Planctomyces sp.]|nr:PQQ-binding-like beta-propeller repeat protein [Planctomyces sp.]
MTARDDVSRNPWDAPTSLEPDRGPDQSVRHPADLVFVGFNSRVCALDRDTGELVWSWKAPQGSGFVGLLFDTDRLIVSVQGYTYCLNASSGEQMWKNPLTGMGVGVPCLASISGASPTGMMQEAQTQKQSG